MLKILYPYFVLALLVGFFAFWRKRGLRLALWWAALGIPVWLALAWGADRFLNIWYASLMYGSPLSGALAVLAGLGLMVALPCAVVAAVGMVLTLTVTIKRLRGWAVALLAFPMLILLIGGGLWVGFRCSFTDPRNDLRQWQFRRAFGQIQHPGDSRLLAERDALGLLAGASNHCDFYAGQLRWTPLPPDDVTRFYTGRVIPAAAQAGATTEVLTAFFLPEKAANLNLPDRFQGVEDWGVDLAQYPSGTVYVVFVFDAGYPPGDDWRCH